ncbi:MAG: PAS domain S-box protein [Candidatus Magnetoovum sp. WYHC-5]|nr:PAS domain S-box protein [Candidatus Magnetoovum sp. WYHC-5]
MSDSVEDAYEYAQNIIDSSLDMVFAVNNDNKIIEFNRAFEKMLGYRKEEVFGEAIEMLFCDQTQFDYIVDFIADTGSYIGEVMVQKKNGDTLYVFLSASILRDKKGAPIGYMGIAKDVTERKNWELMILIQSQVDAKMSELAQKLLSMKPASMEDVPNIILDFSLRLTRSKFGYAGYIDKSTGFLISPTITQDIWQTYDVEKKTYVFKNFVGLWGWVLKNKKPLLTNDPQHDSRSSGTPVGHIPIKRFLCVPVMIGDEIVGQIALANSETDYTDYEMNIASQIASFYALAIQWIRAETEINRINRVQSALSACNEAVIHIRNENMLLKEICKIVVEIAGYMMAWVGFKIYDEKKTIRPVEQYGFEDGYLSKITFTWDSKNKSAMDFAGMAVSEKKPCIIKNISEDPTSALWKDEALSRGYGSIISIPLTLNANVLGVLNIISKEPDVFNEKEVNLLLKISTNLTYGIVSIRILNERDRAEEALRESEQRYRTFVELSPDVVVLLIDEQIAFINTNGAKLFGVKSEDDLIGKPLLDFILPEDKPGVVNSLISLFNGENVAPYEYRIKRFDGKETYVETYSVLIRYDGTEAALLIARDITARKKTEIELTNKTIELEQLTQNLEETIQAEIKSGLEKEKLLIQQSKLAVMGEMLSMISHQWRQPLSTLSTLNLDLKIELALNNFANSTIAGLFDEIEENIQFLSKTIDDFRNFFRPSTQKNILSLNEVIDKAISLVGKSISSKGITIDTDYDFSASEDKYPNELIQVFINILKNAQDVIHSKHVENGRIYIKGKVDPFYYVIDMMDNGGGITNEIKDKIFEPYFTTKGEKVGTGLGLYMSKMIVEKHCEGELSFRNTRQGACFTVKLPITTTINQYR